MIAALTFLRQHWKIAIVSAVILLLIVQTFRLQNAASELEAERLGRASDRSDYQRAQAEATARALSDKMKKEAEYAKAAETAQMDYSALRDRYAGLLRAKAAGGAGGRADLPGAAESAALPADAAAGAGVPLGTILIAQSDALICAENTAYAQAAHGWAMALEPQ